MILQSHILLHSDSEHCLIAATLGDISAREQACSGYQLSPSYTDLTFLGPYKSLVVGTVNYTYHSFGPLSGDTSKLLYFLIELQPKLLGVVPYRF